MSLLAEFEEAAARFEAMTPQQKKGVRVRLALSPFEGERAFIRAVKDEQRRRPLVTMH